MPSVIGLRVETVFDVNLKISLALANCLTFKCVFSILTVGGVGGNDIKEIGPGCGDPYLIVFIFLPCRVEDEAVLDRGASFVKHVCDEEEVEGKNSTFLSR